MGLVTRARSQSPLLFLLTSRRDFLQDFYKPRSESGRANFSRQLLSLIPTCSRAINQSGERKGCFMKTKTSPTNSRNRSSRHCGPVGGFLIRIAFALVCFPLSPAAQAVCQQGCDTFNANTFLGDDALVNNTTGMDNTGIGANALHNNTTGTANTAAGFLALFTNTEGVNNTAVGNNALFSNTTGDINTAIGAAALYSNSSGNGNTGTGAGALLSNISGFNNTATGNAALQFNTTGSSNTATGVLALFNNTTGDYNTANGLQALDNNTTGSVNTANGFFALFSNTVGDRNTAVGSNALSSSTTGNDNIALGHNGGQNLTTGSHNIDIGNRGVAGETNTIRIGRPDTQTATFIAGVSGATVPRGVGVVVDSSGHLGTVTSSARYKEAIKAMDNASEAILALKPVTFHYKQELDPDGTPQFGLVAEEVEKVNPDLVARDDQGKAYSLRYEAVNAMLLNEFIKEHQRVEEQTCTVAEQGEQIAQLKTTVAELKSVLEKQAAAIEKVDARIRADQTNPQFVSANP
ncbi:MAG: hypothetical protein DMF26_18985 [Verrucomicrobia bacterium]|nr:MAG: hypothetical protein DMF26_18985 [Verrucomicrobiota bacterium]